MRGGATFQSKQAAREPDAGLGPTVPLQKDHPGLPFPKHLLKELHGYGDEEEGE